MPKTIAKIGKVIFGVALKPLLNLFGGFKIPKQDRLGAPFKQAVAPRRSAFGRVKIGGVYALFEARDKISVDVLALLQGRSQGFVAFYLNDDQVDVALDGGVTDPEDDDKYGADRVFIYSRLGLDTETAYAEVTAQIASWDSAHRGDTVTSMALLCRQAKASNQSKRYPNGLPQPSAVIDAQLVYDPRDEAQVQGDKSTYAFSRNPALCLLAFLTDADGGMGHDYAAKIAPHVDTWIAAADDCDLAEVTEAGTEPRYECAGAYEHDTAPGDVVAAILSSFDGFLSPAGDGAQVLRPGRYVAPTVTLTDRHVMGYSVAHYQPDEQVTNVFVVSYIDPTADFNKGDAGEVRDEADIAARGKERSSGLDLDWVQSKSQAVRLAKRRLAREVAPTRGTLTCNMMALEALGERFLRLQISDNAALADLVVEVVGTLQVDTVKQQVAFPWVAVDEAVDDGDPGGDVELPSPPDPRPSPDPLAAPTIDTLTALYEDSGADVAGARIQIDLTAPFDSDVEWLARWRPQGSSDWHEADYSDIDDGAAVTLVTGFVPATGTIEVQAAYRTVSQVSPWSATETIDVAAPVAGATEITASEDLAAGNLVNVWNSSGAKVRKADATTAGKPAHGFVLAAVSSGAPATVYFEGLVGRPVLTPGDYYLSTTPGGVTATPPSGSGNVVQRIGVAVSTTAIDFEADDPVELA